MVNLWSWGSSLIEFHIFEKAFPQARPRFNRQTRAVYSPLENQKPVRRALSQYHLETIDEHFCLTAHFFFKDHKDFKAKDTDNLVKALADSLQAQKVISNDNLMVMCLATKNMCKEDWIWLELRKAEQLNINLEDINKMQLKLHITHHHRTH
jgi:Holliday junction resolvase RusA-like endonuclease